MSGSQAQTGAAFLFFGSKGRIRNHFEGIHIHADAGVLNEYFGIITGSGVVGFFELFIQLDSISLSEGFCSLEAVSIAFMAVRHSS